MGRSNRLKVKGGIFHLTHRCHNQSYLLKFSRDRHLYRRRLRETLDEFRLSLLDYTITSNHVHLLVDSADKQEVSGLMRKVAGEFAREYNRRRGRKNAFWGDSFHATLVEDGRYLRECLLYIELNMVRCGAVRHPRDWPWVGYHEIMGHRKRYRLLDLERLCWRFGCGSLAEVQKQIELGIQEKIVRGELRRVAHWTQSLGVGSREFLERFQGQMFTRLETQIEEETDGIFVLREEPTPYTHFLAPKNAAKDQF